MVLSPRPCLCVLLLASLFVTTPGCATLRKMHLLPRRHAKAAAATAEAPHRVGTITLVNETERFVLIDMGAFGAPAAGTALKTFTGETASGVVAIGNVNRRPFVVADIMQGAPQKGDAVFQ